MVKISLKQVSAQKPEKESDEEKITIPQAYVSLHTFFFLLWPFCSTVSLCGQIIIVLQPLKKCVLFVDADSGVLVIYAPCN